MISQVKTICTPTRREILQNTKYYYYLLVVYLILLLTIFSSCVMEEGGGGTTDCLDGSSERLYDGSFSFPWTVAAHPCIICSFLWLSSVEIAAVAILVFHAKSDLEFTRVFIHETVVIAYHPQLTQWEGMLLLLLHAYAGRRLFSPRLPIIHAHKWCCR